MDDPAPLQCREEEDFAGICPCPLLHDIQIVVPISIHHNWEMLEDYLVEHLPAVGQLDACGCELTLVDADTHQVLCDPIHDELWNNMRFHLVAQDCFQSYSCKEQIQRDVYEAHPRDLCPCQ